MKKVVINRCYGGFGLSHEAIMRIAEIKGIKLYTEDNFDVHGISREDKTLVMVVEELGEKANGDCAELKIIEIPNDVEYTIEEYDGSEWIAEVHRTWS
jgi:ABC-type transporter Mla MlaB component